jgi:hypothetical protein
VERRVASRVWVVLGIIVAVIIGVFVIDFVFWDVYKVAPLVTLYGIERWAIFLAQLVVLFYTFPAFKRTKRRGFLYIAIAALIFMYALVFGIIFPATHMARGQAQWYYVARVLGYIIGLGFYARGIMLLCEDV